MAENWWRIGMRFLLGSLVLSVILQDVLQRFLQEFSITTTEVLVALLVIGNIIILDSIELTNTRRAETLKMGFYLGMWPILVELADIGSPTKILGLLSFLGGILYITGIVFRKMFYPVIDRIFKLSA